MINLNAMALHRNIEIKARLADPDQAGEIARQLAGKAGEELVQEDIFFCVPNGRMKLRILKPDYGELIFYQRADEANARVSSYAISVTREPARLLEVLSLSLAPRLIVRKRRELYLVGQSRIHVDSVEGLGSFLEIEYVMRPGEDEAEARRVVHELMTRLNIKDEDLINRAYVDLLEAGK